MNLNFVFHDTNFLLLLVVIQVKMAEKLRRWSRHQAKARTGRRKFPIPTPKLLEMVVLGWSTRPNYVIPAKWSPLKKSFKTRGLR